MSRRIADKIKRERLEGEVYRWELADRRWAGHTAFVVLHAGEVTLGDRYADESFTQSVTCHFQDLLDGCFQGLIEEGFSRQVLDEVIAAVEASTAPTRAAQPEPLPEQRWAASQPAPEPEETPEQKETTAALRSHVAATITAVRSIDLALTVALKSVTKLPTKTLVDELCGLPYVIGTAIPRQTAELIRGQLAELGATVELS